VLPTSFLQSLQGIKGFEETSFVSVHQSADKITSIRLNPFKNRWQGDINHPVPWCDLGFYLTERPSFTFDPFFHAGAYYVQEASSMFLWEIFKQTNGNNTEGLKILDLCAAPGGKSTLIASYFTNSLIVCNEIIKARANILEENITKWGNSNVVVTNNNPKSFSLLVNFFDIIVVDAPCSGSGLFRKDPNAINEWSENNVDLCSDRQEKIIADIIVALKEDGLLIYSTCSYSKKEDEEILDKIIEQHDLESVSILLNKEWNIVESTSDKKRAWGYRFYPNLLKGEGFFVSVLKKKSGGFIGYFQEQRLLIPTKNEIQTINRHINLNNNFEYFKQGESIKIFPLAFYTDLQILAKYLYIKKAGIELGVVKGSNLIPHHELALSHLEIPSFNKLDLDKETALKYLKRSDLMIENAVLGWTLLTYCGLCLGWSKVLPNRMNNYYPTSWRILKD